MRVAVGPLVIDVTFDSAGPYMPSMGFALGPVDEAAPVAQLRGVQKAAVRSYRRTLSATLVMVKPGTSDVDAIVAEVKRISSAVRGPITAEEQITVADRQAAFIEVKYLDNGIPVLVQAALFVANGVLHTITLACLDAEKAADCRKQFRAALANVTAFGDSKK